MLENNTKAANTFYRLVRNFCLSIKPWDSAIYYQTLPDERLDLSLVSERVYKRRSEWLTIMAAAGLDSVEDKLLEQKLVLPTETQLANFKKRSGYESIVAFRK